MDLFHEEVIAGAEAYQPSEWNTATGFSSTGIPACATVTPQHSNQFLPLARERSSFFSSVGFSVRPQNIAAQLPILDSRALAFFAFSGTGTLVYPENRRACAPFFSAPRQNKQPTRNRTQTKKHFDFPQISCTFRTGENSHVLLSSRQFRRQHSPRRHRHRHTLPSEAPPRTPLRHAPYAFRHSSIHRRLRLARP
jgi:hypothetical protein